MNSKWSCWTPVTNINLCNNKSSSGDTFNQGETSFSLYIIVARGYTHFLKCPINIFDSNKFLYYQFINKDEFFIFPLDIIINKKLTKQKSSSSISDDNCEETEKVQYKKKTMHPNEVDKMEVGVCERDSQQQLNHPKLSEQKNTENTKQSDWHIESETTFKSVLLNKTVEESLIYRKKYILSKDVNTAICDKSPSPRKNVKSHRKSGKRLTSGLNSGDLEQKKMVSFQCVWFLNTYNMPT